MENGVKKYLVREREEKKFGSKRRKSGGPKEGEKGGESQSPETKRSIIKPTKVITHKSHHRGEKAIGAKRLSLLRIF